jgi:hypothetical protein
MLVCVVAFACADEPDPGPAGPTSEELEQQARDREHVCDLHGLCAMEGAYEFEFDECVADLEALSAFSDECAQLYALRNDCFQSLNSCSDLQDALLDPSHPCRSLDADAQFTFCGPVAATTDGG